MSTRESERKGERSREREDERVKRNLRYLNLSLDLNWRPSERVCIYSEGNGREMGREIYGRGVRFVKLC